MQGNSGHFLHFWLLYASVSRPGPATGPPEYKKPYVETSPRFTIYNYDLGERVHWFHSVTKTFDSKKWTPFDRPPYSANFRKVNLLCGGGNKKMAEFITKQIH